MRYSRTANRAQAAADDREPKRMFARRQPDAGAGQCSGTRSAELCAASARARAFCDLAGRCQVRLVISCPTDARGVADLLSHLLRVGAA
jgi:hypothetical protein